MLSILTAFKAKALVLKLEMQRRGAANAPATRVNANENEVRMEGAKEGKERRKKTVNLYTVNLCIVAEGTPTVRYVR
jgi:hypothetical protein